MAAIIFRLMAVPQKMDSIPHHAHSSGFDVYRPFLGGTPVITEKLLEFLLIILFKTHLKCLKFSLTFTLLLAVLLTLLTTYFRIG